MNAIVKYLGVLLVFIGVIILGVYAANPSVSNTPLVSSLLLMIGGMIIYVVLNKIFD